MPKHRIGLYLGADPHAGGVFQYNLAVLDAVASLPRESYSVVVAYSHSGWKELLRGKQLEEVCVLPGFVAHSIGKVWRKSFLPIGPWRVVSQYLHPFVRALLKLKCELWVFPSQDDWAYQIPVRSLVAIHDLMHRYEKQFPEVSANGEFERREYLYSNLCRYAAGILVDSAKGKEQTIESYNADPTHIHVLPYIAPAYMKNESARPDFDSMYDLPHKFLFYPAQFWEHKNHKAIVRALANLRSKLPDLKFVFVGSKKNGYESLQSLIRELDLEHMVKFLGYVPDADMPTLYRRARALVMPTYFGPTNIPPLEAFVAGCPVAVSNIYGMEKQMNGAALLFDQKSDRELEDSIFKLWTDDALCRELAQKGRSHAEKWGQKHFSEEFSKIISKLLG